MFFDEINLDVSTLYAMKLVKNGMNYVSIL